MNLSRAAVLRGLHRPGDPLLLPNVWDCQSARLVAAAGLAAVATSSAAVAGSLGFADGEAAPAGEMFDAVARIVAAVEVPVTADLERGYGLAPAELVERLAATGAVGCNLEDSDPRTGALVEAERQADFLAGVRAAAQQCGVDVVINGRIDTYLRKRGEYLMTAGERLAETIRRAQLYRAAGADCVFPILIAHEAGEAAVAEVVRAAGGPVNVLAGPGELAGPKNLAALGVARISFGPSLYHACGTHLAGLITDLTTGGTP